MKAKTNTKKTQPPIACANAGALPCGREAASPSAELTRGWGPAATAGECWTHGRHKVTLMCQGEQKTLCLQPCSAGNTHLHS